MPRKIRRVVSGIDEGGKSGWSSDGPAGAYLQYGEPASRITDIWHIPAAPPNVRDDHAPTAVTLWPPVDGLVFRICEVPPRRSKIEDAIVAVDGIPLPLGMHASETVDLMVVISGEIWAYQKDADEPVHLKQGDTLIQRGTVHCWENRGDEPCLYASVLVGATRS